MAPTANIAGLSIPARRSAIPEPLRRTAEPIRLLGYACLDWACILTLWGLMIVSPHWLYPLEWLLIAGRMHALGVVLHDACHRRTKHLSPATRILQILAGYPIATTLAAMRYHHLRHHRFSGMALDPYLKVGISGNPFRRNVRRALGLLLVPVWILRCFYGSIALLVPRLRPSYCRWFLQDRSNRSLTQDPQVLECLKSEPGQALWFAAVAFVLWRYPSLVITGYAVPLLIAGALNVNRVIVEHRHVSCADRRPETVLATTHTQRSGVWGRLFLFPRNIGFHQAHHLYPEVALQCLPTLDRYLRSAASADDSPLPTRSPFQQKKMPHANEPSASPANASTT